MVMFEGAEEIRQLVGEEDRCEGDEVVPDTGLECLEDEVDKAADLVSTRSLMILKVDVVGYLDSFFLFLFFLFLFLVSVFLIISGFLSGRRCIENCGICEVVIIKVDSTRALIALQSASLTI